MATTGQSENATKSQQRHLRPRESMKKTVPFDLDAPSAACSSGKGTNLAEMMMDEDVDDELSANISASYYIGQRGPVKRKLEAVTVRNTPKRRRVIIKSGNNGSSVGDHVTDSSTDEDNPNEELQDVYCWECHKECVDGALDCVACPRTYHPSCIPSNLRTECGTEPSDNWTCPACLTIMKAECADTRSWAMQQLNIDQFSTLLGFALNRMKYPDVKTSEAFHNPVPKSLLPDYYDVIFHPMDLSRLDRNVKKKTYASTEAFLEDAKWILHNTIIFYGLNNKHAADARLILKICRHEVSEIELCPECYMNSCVKKETWFSQPCTLPHCLVWAKLKGFPFWPAKALRVSNQNMVDVRFFGAHDRAWISSNQVYLLSQECPVPMKTTKKFGLDAAMEELNLHISLLKEKYGEFHYAPLRIEFKPEYLHFCAILFGKTLANSDAAKKWSAMKGEHGIYDTPGPAVGTDEHPASENLDRQNSNPDELQNRDGVDDGHASDEEDAPELAEKTKSKKNDLSQFMDEPIKNQKTPERLSNSSTTSSVDTANSNSSSGDKRNGDRGLKLRIILGSGNKKTVEIESVNSANRNKNQNTDNTSPTGGKEKIKAH